MGEGQADEDDDDTGMGGEAARPSSTGGALAYVIGPLHGQLDLLRELVGLLVADALAAKPAERPILVFVGDYLGGGPGATGVLDFILDLKARPIFEVHVLQGRDDRALVNFLEAPAADARWIVEADGAATLQAYGLAAPSPRANIFAWNDAADAFRSVLPKGHLAFLKTLETLVSVGDYAFVHGGLRPPSQGGALNAIQWIHGSPFRQGYRFEHASAKGVRQRTGPAGGEDEGHTAPWISGELFALRLQDTRQTVFQATAG